MIKQIKIPFLINKGVELIGAFILEDNDNNIQFLKKKINDFGVKIYNQNNEYILVFNNEKLAKLACSSIGRQINNQNILKIDWIDLFINEENSVCF